MSLILLDENDVSSELSNNLDSKEFWGKVHQLLVKNTLLTPKALEAIFSLMQEQLRSYLSQKSKNTWGYLMNKIGARPTRSKLYFNVLEKFSKDCELNKLLEIKNKLSSIKCSRSNSIIPSKLSDLLGNVKVIKSGEPVNLEFEDVSKILKKLKVTEVIDYFGGLLGHAINRTYAAIGHDEFTLNFKKKMTFIMIKLSLYEKINTFFELNKDFSACKNLVKFNKQAGEDIYKMENLDKDTLTKELEGARQLFSQVKKAFKEQDFKNLLKCINKNKSNETDMCTILATLETLQISHNQMEREIEQEISALKEK